MKRELFFMLTLLICISGCGSNSTATEPPQEVELGIGHGSLEFGDPDNLDIQVVHTDTLDILYLNGKRYWSTSYNYGSPAISYKEQARLATEGANSLEEWKRIFISFLEEHGARIMIHNDGGYLEVFPSVGGEYMVFFPSDFPVQCQSLKTPPHNNFEGYIADIHYCVEEGDWLVWGEDYAPKAISFFWVPLHRTLLERILSGEELSEEEKAGTIFQDEAVLEDVIEARGNAR